jgi:hypothetical protein
MAARFAVRSTLIAIGAGLLLALGLTVQGHVSPLHDKVVAAPSTQLASSDDRQLVRAVDAVFVGRVDAAEPTEMVGSMPYTRFDITVIDVLKGSLGGQVTLAQLGGVVPARHERVVVAGDAPLEPGSVYLFCAQRSTAADALVVVPGHGHIDLTADVLNPRALTAESARTIPRVARMRSVINLRPLN